MSGTYTFKTKSGKLYSAKAKDADRARCIAKRQALADGVQWGGVQLVKFSNAM